MERHLEPAGIPDAACLVQRAYPGATNPVFIAEMSAGITDAVAVIAHFLGRLTKPENIRAVLQSIALRRRAAAAVIEIERLETAERAFAALDLSPPKLTATELLWLKSARRRRGAPEDIDPDELDVADRLTLRTIRAHELQKAQHFAGLRFMYGYPLPGTVDELVEYQRLVGAPPHETLETSRVIDMLYDEEHDRHYPFYRQGCRILGVGRGSGRTGRRNVHEINNREIVLSDVAFIGSNTPGSSRLIVAHPTFETSRVIREFAYKQLGELIFDPGTLPVFIDRLARALSLLYAAQPWYWGTPSILESFADSLLRCAFGHTFRPKRSEPFWSAMWNGVLSGADYLAHFGGSQSVDEKRDFVDVA